jgi:hypothetical protein
MHSLHIRQQFLAFRGVLVFANALSLRRIEFLKPSVVATRQSIRLICHPCAGCHCQAYGVAAGLVPTYGGVGTCSFTLATLVDGPPSILRAEEDEEPNATVNKARGASWLVCFRIPSLLLLAS